MIQPRGNPGQPRDAIALALAAGAPVTVDPAVFDALAQAGPQTVSSLGDEPRWLTEGEGAEAIVAEIKAGAGPFAGARLSAVEEALRERDAGEGQGKG